MKNKLKLLLSICGFFAVAIYIYTSVFNSSAPPETGGGNVHFSANIDDVQILYRKLEDKDSRELASELAEFFSKDYTVLGRTPLEANLDEGTYYIVAKKFRGIPRLKTVVISETRQEINFNMMFGYRYVDRGMFKHGGELRSIKPFFFAETELTNAAYAEFLEATGTEPSFYEHDTRRNAADQPVIGITYAEAVAYTAWLSEQTGQNCRLPYEHEWEFVASRGDTNRLYPWGNFEKRGNSYLANYHPFNFEQARLEPINIDGFHFPAPVGSYPPTDKRFYDLGGNVLEWCLDSIADKAKYPDFNLDETPLEHSRIVKGGSWNFNQRLMQIKSRVFVDGRIKEGNTGIRILVEL